MEIDPFKLQALLNLGHSVYEEAIKAGISDLTVLEGATYDDIHPSNPDGPLVRIPEPRVTPQHAIEKANELFEAALFAAQPQQRSPIIQFPAQPGIV